MENPLSWNKYQKCISFHMSDVGEGKVNNVVSGLIEEGHLQESQRFPALAAVQRGFDRFEKQMRSHICGHSSITVVYHSLRDAGLVE